MKQYLQYLNSKMLPGAIASLALLVLVGGSRSVLGQANTFPSSGNVGIGTTAPSTSLHVATESTAATRGIVAAQSSTDVNGSMFSFWKSRGTIASPTVVGSSDSVGNLYSYGYDGSSYISGAKLKFVVDGTVTVGTLPTNFQIFTGSSGGGTERMRITSAGNVGIGTGSPSLTRLHVVHNTATEATILAEAGSSMSPAMEFKDAAATPNRWRIGSGWNTTTDGLFFIYDKRQATARMIIDTSGNVGIGTSSPGLSVDVRGNAVAFTSSARALIGAYDLTSMAQGVGGGIQFGGKYHTNGSVAGFASISGVKENGTDNDFSSALVFTTRSMPNTQTERMRIGSTGNVGIGTTTPLYSLDVNGGTNGFRAKAASSSSNDTIATFESASGIQAIVRANGYFGIGTISPTAKLDVNGNTKVNGNIDVTGTGNINAAGTISGGNIVAKYQDVAEWVPSSQQLSAGTVVVLDHTKSNQVIASSQAYDTRVAGVISLQPGITLGENGAGKVLVATTGRVKVKVDASAGPIHVGDLLVTGDKEGIAKKSEPLNLGGVAIHRPGTLIGKALEPLEKGTGEILVLLSLQ